MRPDPRRPDSATKAILSTFDFSSFTGIRKNHSSLRLQTQTVGWEGFGWREGGKGLPASETVIHGPQVFSRRACFRSPLICRVQPPARLLASQRGRFFAFFSWSRKWLRKLKLSKTRTRKILCYANISNICLNGHSSQKFPTCGGDIPTRLFAARGRGLIHME